jgi:alcohol dehydrogenase
MNYDSEAKKMLASWKKDDYAFGTGVLKKTGGFAARAGRSTMLVATGWGTSGWINPIIEEIKSSLKEKGINIISIIRGASPNAPREDVYRIASQIGKKNPGSIMAVGGGSTIDAAKAAVVLSTLDPDDVETYFGTGLVTDRLKYEKKRLTPVIAVQTTASSGAHLTRYSNITDPLTGQKKLIIDDAIIPPLAVFDYRTSMGAPYALKADGALDGMAHCLEVVCGASGRPFFEKTMKISGAGISLIVENLPEVLVRPGDDSPAEAIGLATDLGGYAIMVGGTNYGHLFSFSLVDKLTHGRACAIANPYVTVFFAPAIEPQLKMIGNIFKRAGYIGENINKYSARELGIAVARGMIKFIKEIKVPTTFGEAGIDGKDKKRILNAAKNPQLWSKLEQAPVSLISRYPDGRVNKEKTEENIEKYMGSLIDAIISGDFDRIKNMSGV